MRVSFVAVYIRDGSCCPLVEQQSTCRFFVQASNSPPGERRGAEWEKWKIAECEVRCMIAGDIEEEIAIDSEERLIE